MKKKYLVPLSVLYFFVAFALNASAQLNTNDDYAIYNNTSVEKVAEFPGGMEAFYNYIGENFVLPTNQEFKGGRIIASFVIEKDGSVTDVKVFREIGFGTTEETIRILKACPLWNPAEQDGKKVRVQFNLPINLQPPPVVEEVESNNVYDINEVFTKPEFPGGNSKLVSFIAKNFRAPDKNGLYGQVIVKFIVEIDGSLSNFEVISNTVGYGSDKEALRVLKLSPKWNPAELDGKMIRCSFVFPITILTPND